MPFADATIQRFNRVDENGKRYKENTLADGRITRTYMKEEGKLVPDYWIFPIVNRTYAEYVDYATQKPEALLERIIKASSNEGDLILDPFMGIGSTGVACMNTNRKFIGIELDENYFNIAKQRIEEACK